MRSFALLPLALLSACAAAQAPFYLHDGDRVVFYGDSITDNGPYTQFIETFVVTRFPKMNVHFVGSGWGGDRVTGGGGGDIDKRLNRDVMPYRPTVVTVMLGMNDASYRAFDQNIFNTYDNGYRHIVDRFKREIPNARVWLVQPSPFDDVTQPVSFEGGYNAVLRRYSEYVAKLAGEYHYSTVDFNTPVVDMLTQAKALDAETAKKIIPDRVHPGPAGHLIMAEAMLKAWNAPSLVSSVDIDATGGASAQNATVKDVKHDASRVSWTATEGSLPFWIDRENDRIKLVLKASDLDQAWNQEILKVRNLPAEKYTLNIDGAAIGTFSRDDLANGINLALYDTPMVRQAREVHAMTMRRTNEEYVSWRAIMVPLEAYPSPAQQRALIGLRGLEEDLYKRQHALAQPVPHKFELVAG